MLKIQPKPSPDLTNRNDAAFDAIRVICIYALFSGFWILLSDNLIDRVFRDPEEFGRISTIKEWFYVCVTCALLYGLIRRMQARMLDATQRAVVALEIQKKLTAANAALEIQVAQRTQDLMDLYDNAPCGYHSLGPDGTILRANRTELRMLGYEEDEFIGHRIVEFMTPSSVKTFHENYPRFLKTGHVGNLEFDFICKDGTIRPVLVDANMLETPEGAPRFSRSTLVDNTERKAQAAQIESLNKLLQEVVESLPYGVVVLDDARTVRLKNRRVSELLDYPNEFLDQDRVGFNEMVRLHWERGDYGDRPFEDVLTHFVNAMVARQIVKVERQQANGLFLEICGKPLSDGWTLLTYTDITDHKLAEQTLDRAMQTAKAATAAKSNFLANASHELRTPMNAILGFSYVLEQADLPSTAHHLVQKIRSASKSLMALLNDVLDFSKIESGKLELHSSPFNLYGLLDNLASIMSISAQNKDLELLISPPLIGDTELIGDAMRLEQVLINLTGNAIKFTSTGHVALHIDRQDEAEEYVTLRFAVRDSGIGIPENKLQSIFSEFAQADASTSLQYGGTGLGLTISKRLVEGMGGVLNVASVLGEGSEFCFSLKFKRTQPPFIRPDSGRDVSVWIADSRALSAEALRITVTDLGWQATVFTCSADLLSRLKSQPSGFPINTVLVLDLNMPGMSELQTALDEEQKQPSSGRLLVLLTSSHAQDGWITPQQAHMAAPILVKPITPTALRVAVSNGLSARDGDEKPPAPVSANRLADLRLLVVDDNEVNREVAQLIFSMEGASVTTASDGQAAIDWLAAHAGEVDIVLMDVQMPLMNGFEVTKAIRHIDGFNSLPVVALSADALSEQRMLADESGMNGYITKPIDVDTAVELILQLAGPGKSVSTAKFDLPGIALSSALAIWRDEGRYKKFLRRFVSHYGSIVQNLLDADAADAKALTHKFRGAAANLGLIDVAAATLSVEAMLTDKPLDRETVIDLRSAMAVALVSIECYTQAHEQALPSSPNTVPAEISSQDLQRLLIAWQSDCSVDVQTTLARVRHGLTALEQDVQQTLLDSYDFRAGEEATQTLIRARPPHSRSI